MNFIDIIIYIILPLGVAGYLFLKKKYSYFEEQGIPHIKPSWLLGNLNGVGQSIHMADFVRKVYEECKGKDVIAGFYSFFSPSIIITDLELAKQILVKDFNSFPDRGFFVNEEKDILTGSLVSIDGERWRFLRNKMSPAFSSGKIKMMYSVVSDKGDNMITAITKAAKIGSVDVRDMTVRFTIDITSSCAFGMESNTLNRENPEFVSIFRKIFGEDGGLVYFLFIMNFPKFARFLNLRQFEKKIIDFFTNIITDSVNHRETSNVERKDFLNMLIQLKNKGSIDGEFSTDVTKLNMNEVIAQAFVFFLGGVETSSTVISFAITELSYHPELQERLRQEIQDKTKGTITYDNLNDLTYLNQVMNESLRRFSPGFAGFRQAAADYKIPNSKHVIKKGTKVMIPAMGFHYDPNFWKNPDQFDPEHFTQEEVAKRPHMAFTPFGEGPRNCIGMRFAQVTVKYAIAKIISNFKVTLDTKKVQLPLQVDPKSTNLAPVGGFWVNFEKI